MFNILKTSITAFALLLALCVSVPSAAATNLIPEPPKIEATAYLLMDARTGHIITSYNADTRLPPASLTKLMTSYIVSHEIAKGTISENDQVKISVKAWQTGGSRMFIKEGTFVSVLDLLKGVIIQSGNDASVALAEYVAGDESAFVDLMNRYALELGMNDTHFENATGLPHELHLTTAKDLAKLARAIIYEHQHYRLYSQKSFTYNNIQQANRNTLIFGELAVDGLKTGHTEEAGYCLVASAEEKGTRLISVIMGTDSERARARESKKLLTYGFRFFETAQLYQAGESISQQKLWMGTHDTIDLGVSEDLLVTIPKGSEKSLKANIDVNAFIKAPVKQGDKLGTLKITLEDKIIAQTDLLALGDEEKGGLFKQLIDFILLFFASFLQA